MIFVFFPTKNNNFSSFGASYISLVYSTPVNLYSTKCLETVFSDPKLLEFHSFQITNFMSLSYGLHFTTG
jgi:hypothetical protein